LDIVLLIIGFIAAIVQGFLAPCSIYLMGHVGSTFAQRVFDKCQFLATAQCPLGIELNEINYDHYNK
jgi:hypothetical protein